MRLAAVCAWMSLGLLAVACGDEDPDPVVNEDIAWRVGCAMGDCGAGLGVHSQPADPETPYKVDCSSSGGYFSFTIIDPGLTTEEAALDVNREPRYPSELIVNNISEAGSCNVNVRERAPGDSAPISYRAACGKGCTIRQLGKQDGWDFVAELLCDGLRPNGNPVEGNPYLSLSAPSDRTRPVLIKLANCN